MKIALLQLDLVWEDRAANHQQAEAMVAMAAQAGARLAVLPEMWSCGFSMNTAVVAEPYDGPSVAWMRARAEQHRMWVGGSVPELSPATADADPRPYNTFVLAAPSGEVHRYRKIHPFTYAQEHNHYRAGTEHVTVEVEGVRCSLFVCYDLRFGDEFWVRAPETDCYVVVANWPRSRREHWSTLLRARAIENQAYVVAVNRVGQGGKLDYAGDSCAIDPLGNVLVCAAEQPTMLLCDVDPQAVTQVRERFPFLQDRR